jgi:hypothetical protein
VVVVAAVIDLNLTSIRPIDPTTWVEGNLSATLAVRPPPMNSCRADAFSLKSVDSTASSSEPRRSQPCQQEGNAEESRDQIAGTTGAHIQRGAISASAVAGMLPVASRRTTRQSMVRLKP